jgi:TrmH family RNA methyltransferase
MRIETITSAQNPKVKDLLTLQEKSKERRKKGLFVVEGRRELLHCIEAGYEPYAVFFCPEIISNSDFDEIAEKFRMVGTIENNHRDILKNILTELRDGTLYAGAPENASWFCTNC